MSVSERTSLDARERLIVALDVASLADAEAIVARLGDTVSFYKIGYRLGYAGGLDLARRLIDTGKQIFLDFKLHDIANTVADGTASLAQTGATYLTVHAYPQTMTAALEGRAGTDLKILAVTVLTSYDDTDLKEAGYGLGVSDLVRRRAEQAKALGVDGLICSPHEAKSLRGVVGESIALITPGVRPAGSAKGDQKRIMTPKDAIVAGADRLVVGRPVIAADDPQRAAAAIIKEIEEGAS